VINYDAIRIQYEKMYEDKVAVQRSERIKKPNGATEVGWVVKHSNVPCRISQTGLAANTQTDTTNDIDYSSKLFISPQTDILQGDKLTVTRGGITRGYTAGEPFIYPTHQEINLDRDVKA